MFFIFYQESIAMHTVTNVMPMSSCQCRHANVMVRESHLKQRELTGSKSFCQKRSCRIRPCIHNLLLLVLRNNLGFLGNSIQDSGFRIQDSAFSIQGSAFTVPASLWYPQTTLRATTSTARALGGPPFPPLQFAPRSLRNC